MLLKMNTNQNLLQQNKTVVLSNQKLNSPIPFQSIFFSIHSVWEEGGDDFRSPEIHW